MQPQDAAQAQDNPPILLVEDDPSTRMLTVQRLKRLGYTAQAATNGAEALALMRRQFIPLLLTDWDMPEMDGLALCQAVRETPLEGYVYIIVLTARGGKDSIVAGLRAGADDYLTKPFEDPELAARLNTGRRILRLEQSLRLANHRNHLLSITDSLTATYNRRYLMDSLPLEIERAARSRGSLSVVLCDLDHFKKINDTHGHQAGDDVLRGFAGMLLGRTRRDIDWVVRYGGEEFLVVLPGTAVREAMECAEKMRIAVAAQPFATCAGPMHISASFGVAGHDALEAGEQASVDSLIAYADLCLYRSKGTGRNRVTGKELDIGGRTIVLERPA
jgi:diguanylate cyclase (GGDEF)-like protein